ncbi:MAG: acyltransferase [Pseudomonadales bacterium]|nr:acyltransferase [Pseudomonadales bacterium]
MNEISIRYRPEVDGLRALAVLPVAFYHAEFEFVSGGYVGVDIFFVISGYLITSLILKDLRTESFSMTNFWMRRIRRILPVSLLVMMTVLAAFYFVYPSSMYMDLAGSVLAQNIFVSNIYFWLGSGYFDPASELKPLLHNWSLSVEEQYYFIFPICLLVLYKWNPRLLFVFVVGVVFISLVLALFFTEIYPGAAFYTLPTRAWELGVGAMLALLPLKYHVKGNVTANIISFLALLMMIYPMLMYDELTSFPGKNAIFPVAGAALFIYSSTLVRTEIGKIFSLRYVVLIGLLSYSFYLWHWCAIVFYKALCLVPPKPLQLLLPLAVSFILAALSYKYVETPIRKNVVVFTNKKLLIGVAVVIAALLLFSSFVYVKNGLEGRFEFNVDPKRSIRQEECFENFYEGELKSCELISTGAAPNYIAVGDSHNLSMLPVFEAISKKYGVNGVFMGVGGCLPFWGAVPAASTHDQERCTMLHDKMKHFIVDQGIKLVFLTSRWTYYTDRSPFGSGGFTPIKDDVSSVVSLENSRAVFLRRFHYMEQVFREYGVKAVLINQVPHQNYWPFEIAVRSEIHSIDPNELGVTKYEHKQFQRFVVDLFSSSDVFEVLSFDEILCERKCKVFMDGEPIYYDDDHLSIVGSKYIQPVVEESFKSLFFGVD